MKPMIKIVNLADNSEIEREMNDEEFKTYEMQQARYEKQKELALAKATAKIALLEKLGITEEEAKLLLG